MEKYDVINVVGEGSYGLVMRCRHRESGQYVAIKKFLETEDDPTVRKMAIREIRMLKKLRHENLVNMLEVFRRRKRFFLVFEYLEHTVLEELEARAGGLGYLTSRKYIFQVLRALNFIHSHNVIHRDIKPENVLVSRLGVIKLCDFGFARHYTENETFTDYVATRWYRSPELLVGDPRYGKEVDIWAVGCLYSEMMTGEPIFPGESDIDQLFQIVRVLGKLNSRHQILITKNSMFKGMKQEQNTSLIEMFPDWNRDSLDFLIQCLKMDGDHRPDTETLLKHDLFTRDDFIENFLPELRAKITQESQTNPLLKRIGGFETPGNKSGGGGGGGGGGVGDRSKAEASAKLNSTNAKERVAQISLSSLNNNHRLSFGNEEQLAPFRHYLINSQQKQQQQQQQSIKQISINNLILRDNDSKGMSRVVSAKLQKNQSEKINFSQAQYQIEIAPPSPVQFQSLQPELVSSQNLEGSGQNKRHSPINNHNTIGHTAIPGGGGQYFNQKKSNNILSLQQVAQQKGNKSYSQAVHQMPPPSSRILLPKASRSNLLDVNILPLTINGNSDISKEHSPRTFPPSSYPWMSSNIKGSAMNKTYLVKKPLTDWKSVAREPGDFLLPNCPGTSTSTSPYKGNKKKLSPMSTLSFQDKIPENFNSPTPRNTSVSSDQENEI